MAVELDAARLLIDCGASNAGAGLPNTTEASRAKTTPTCASEVAIRVTNQARQMFGGHCCLKSMGVERYLRGARIGALGGGTPQIQCNIIASSLPVRASL